VFRQDLDASLALGATCLHLLSFPNSGCLELTPREINVPPTLTLVRAAQDFGGDGNADAVRELGTREPAHITESLGLLVG
jgi:hypothetical protein